MDMSMDAATAHTLAQHDLASNPNIIRYEDISAGQPPASGPSAVAPAPGTFDSTPLVSTSRYDPRASDPLKRDSGTAPSDRAASDKVNYDTPSPALSYIRPNLPPVQVSDGVPAVPRRSKSPFSRRRRMSDKRVETLRLSSGSESRSEGIQRVASFHGIEMAIPSASLGDMIREDNVDFAIREDALLDGHREKEAMNGVVESQQEKNRVRSSPLVDSTIARWGPLTEQVTSGSSRTARSAVADPVPAEKHASISNLQAEHTVLMASPQPEQEVPSPLPELGSVVSRPTTPPRLQDPERKPSLQMLHTNTSGGRVLSAEDHGFSMKLRSMYENGDEASTELDTPRRSGSNTCRDDTPERDLRSPDPDIQSLHIVKHRQPLSNGHGGPHSPSPVDRRISHLRREPNELAGGIEDWKNLQARDIDRYGFILPTTITSGDSKAIDRPGIQRMATSLRVLSTTSRRDLSSRKTSAAKTAQAPTRPDSVNSVRSTTSSVRTSNPFRSRDRRLIDEAVIMLTLPPALAKISEHDDRTRNDLKRKERSREEKWFKMARQTSHSARGAGMSFTFNTHDPKVVSRTWKGIPDRWRATAWHAFLTASAKSRGTFTSDEDLTARFHALQADSCADDVQIDVDVPRTINAHIMFRRRYRGGQRLLFRVLHALSLYFPATGYVQGMAALAATLLCYYDEARAFVMLVRMWELRGLRALFGAGFGRLMAALADFETHWLPGDVAAKLRALGVDAPVYATRWYLTLFNMSVPFSAMLRVWDVFMLLGDAPVDSYYGSRPVAGAAAASRGPGAGPGTGTGTGTGTESSALGGTGMQDAAPATGFEGADLAVLHATSAALVAATRGIIMPADFEEAMKVLGSWMPVKDEDLFMRVALVEWKANKKRMLAA